MTEADLQTGGCADAKMTVILSIIGNRVGGEALVAPRYPGARWYGIGGNGRSCTHRSCSWHEAVTTAGVDAIADWVRDARSCHGFTAKDGDAGQFADFDDAVNGTYAGNADVLTWENWDGLTASTGRSPDGSFGPNDIGFTAQQQERNSDIMAWMADSLGIPLHLMQNTDVPGHGPHRLGVPQANGRVKLNYGPTQWTTHPGKECCGDERILQLPAMLTRAADILAAVRAGRCSWLPIGPVNVSIALARTGTADSDEEELMTAKADIIAEIAASEKRVIAAVNAAAAGITANLNSVRGPSVVQALTAIADAVGAHVTWPPDPTATYTVLAGDTFDAIAAKLMVTPDALGAANPLVTDRNKINVGQVLTIPK